MRVSRVLTASVIASLGISLAVFSCGGDDRAVTLDAPTAEIKSDGAQPVTVRAGQAALEVPDNALDAGATVTLREAPVPAQFGAVSNEVSSAGTPIEIGLKDPARGALTQARAPMTLALEANAAALASVEGAQANLCVFGLRADGAFLVWRNAALKVLGAGRISFATLWAGVYQPYFCGATELPGALAINAAGTGTAVAAATEDATATAALDDPGAIASAEPGSVTSYEGSLGVCATKGRPTCLSTMGFCAIYLGSFYTERTAADACGDGSVGGDGCPTQDLLGCCFVPGSSGTETATAWYSTGQVTAGQAQASCSGTWYPLTASDRSAP